MVRLKHRYVIGQVYFLQRHLQSSHGTTTNLSSSFSSSILPFTTPEKAISAHRIIEIMKQKIQELYGEMGIGEFGQQIVIKYYEQEYSKILVIKVPRGYQKYIQFILSTIASMDDLPVTIRTLQIASCGRTTNEKVQKLMKKYLQYHPKLKESVEGIEERLLANIQSSFQEN